MTIPIIFILRDGTQREAFGEIGDTLLKVAHANGVDDIEGTCSGAMACSTCHVIVDPVWYRQISPASDDETDMLDLATGLTRTSRLACQIKLTESMKGLVVRLPHSTKSLL